MTGLGAGAPRGSVGELRMGRFRGIGLSGLLGGAALTLTLHGCAAERTEPPPPEDASPHSLPKTPQALELTPGSTAEHPIESGEVHLYSFQLAEGEYLGLKALQLGADVELTVSGPGDTPSVEFDSPTGKQDSEEVFWVADTAGEHLLQVKASDADPQSRYRVSVEHLRRADRADQSRAAGARAFSEARRRLKEHSAEAAASHYQEAADRYRDSGDEACEARALFDLGKLWADLPGRRFDGVEVLGRAVELYRRALDLRQEGLAFEKMGDAFLKLQSWQRARSHYETALGLFRRIDDERQQAHTLNELGLVSKYQGQVRRSLELYSEALEIWDRLGDRRERANIHVNMAKLYAALGEDRKAFDGYRRALDLAEPGLYPDLAAVALTGSGDVWLSRGDPRTALESYGQALDLCRRVGDREGEAMTLNSLARAYLHLREPELAGQSFREALALLSNGEAPSYRAAILINLAMLSERLGRPESARGLFEEALGLARSAQHRPYEAQALFGKARLARRDGDLGGARALAEEAIGVAESIHADIGRWDLRSSFLTTKQVYYDFLVEVLVEMHGIDGTAGYGSAAFTVSERARARSLLEALTEVRQQVVQSSEELRRLEELREELNTRHRLRERLRRSGGEANQDEIDRQGRDIEAKLDELYEAEARTRRRHPHWAALNEPVPFSAEQVRADLLDAETLFLEYYFTDAHGYLWAITSEGVRVVDLGSSREILEIARRARQSMAVSHLPTEASMSRLAAAELSRRVLSPVAGLLSRRRLVVVAAGGLEYVPFAALPRPAVAGAEPGPDAPPLVADHEILSVHSAALLGRLRSAAAERPVRARSIAVLADPVTAADDSRLPNSGTSRGPGPDGWERLRFSGQEAEAIRRLTDGVPVFFALGFGADRDAVLGEEVRAAGILHFATHGMIEAEHPELSALLLSRFRPDGTEADGFLRAYEIFNLDLSADLVTLSACRTAFGDELRGEGLVGFTQAFMVAGASRVVVSLWNVNDEATAELMQRFYRGLLRDRLPASVALQQAQASMWGEERWHAPFFWAGFVLQGDWVSDVPSGPPSGL